MTSIFSESFSKTNYVLLVAADGKLPLDLESSGILFPSAKNTKNIGVFFLNTTIDFNITF